GDKILRLPFVAAEFLQGIAPRGQVIPPRPAGSFWIRRNDRNARFHQVVPVFDALGISFSHQKKNGGGVRRTVVGQTLLPIARKRFALLRDDVYIVRQRQSNDVGAEAINHTARLLARAVMRLVYRYFVAGLA